MYFFGSCVWFSVITSILQNASYRQRLFSASLRSLSTLPRQKGTGLRLVKLIIRLRQKPTNKVQNLFDWIDELWSIIVVLNAFDNRDFWPHFKGTSFIGLNKVLSCDFVPGLFCLRNLQQRSLSSMAQCSLWWIGCLHALQSFLFAQQRTKAYVLLNSFLSLWQDAVVCERVTQFNVATKARAWTVSEPCRWELPSLLSRDIRIKDKYKRKANPHIHQKHKEKDTYQIKN